MWARRIYQDGPWSGAQWWSYYDPRWASVGLRRKIALTNLDKVLYPFGAVLLVKVHILKLDDEAVIEAARAISRRIVSG